MYKIFLNFLFFGLVHCMEQAIDTIDLKKKSLINAYPNYPVVGVMLGPERAVNKKNNVWFLEMGEQSFSPQEKVVLSAAKIFLITSNDFDEINNGKTMPADKIYDVQSLVEGKDLVKSGILNNETGSKLNFFSDIDPYCVIVLLIKKLFIDGQECPLIVDAPSIVCCSDELWKWTQRPDVQEKNIFCDTRDKQSITRTPERISLNDLQTADSQVIADGFIMTELTEKTSIDYYNDMIAHIAFLGEVFRDNKEFQGELLGRLEGLSASILLNLNALSVKQIKIGKLSKLLAVYGDPALKIINSIASRAAGIGIGFLGSVIKDGLNLLYRVNNTKLEPIPDSEKPKIKESIEIFYNKNVVKRASSAASLFVPQLDITKKQPIFFLNGSSLNTHPWNFKAHRVTLYEGNNSELDRFMTIKNNLINDNEVKNIIIEQESCTKSYEVDLSSINNSHLILFLPNNYLETKAKHTIAANWITVASNNKIAKEVVANTIPMKDYFSSLQDGQVALMHVNPILSSYNISDELKVFSGYPKQNVAKNDGWSDINELFDSYRGQQFEDEDNKALDSTKLQEEYTDSNKPKEDLIQNVDNPQPKDELHKKEEQDFGQDKRLDLNEIEKDSISILTMDQLKNSLIEKINIITPVLFNNHDQKFHTQNCFKLLEYSRGLNVVNNTYVKDKDRAKIDLISNFFDATIVHDKINLQNDDNIKIVKSSDNQFFIVPVQVIDLLNKNKHKENIILLQTYFISKYNYYYTNLTAESLEDFLKEQYNNQSQDESDSKQSKPVLPLETNNPVESEEEPPVEQQPLDTKWSWYKPWTWSWGGYYFKKETYFKSKPDEARHYEQRLAEESR